MLPHTGVSLLALQLYFFNSKNIPKTDSYANGIGNNYVVLPISIYSVRVCDPVIFYPAVQDPHHGCGEEY